MKKNVENPNALTDLVQAMEVGGFDNRLQVTKSTLYDQYWSIKLYRKGLVVLSHSGLTDNQYWKFRDMYADYFTSIDLALDIDRN